eukprot:15365723-Alexandrium_andersonii.AAC.1
MPKRLPSCPAGLPAACAAAPRVSASWASRALACLLRALPCSSSGARSNCRVSRPAAPCPF